MTKVENECYVRWGSFSKIPWKEKKRLKCIKYFRTLVERGKDVEKILDKKNELGERLDLLEEKTESEFRQILSCIHARTKMVFFSESASQFSNLPR